MSRRHDENDVAALREQVDELRAITAEEAVQVRARIKRIEEDLARLREGETGAARPADDSQAARQAVKGRARRAKRLAGEGELPIKRRRTPRRNRTKRTERD